MHDTGAVRFLQGIADLHAAFQRLFQREGTLRKTRVEALALHIS
jgi:hypothetical protein